MSEHSLAVPDDPAQRRIPTLDGLRGVAILMVMIYHQTIMTSETGLDRLVMGVTQIGWAGVDLFFVLSGFLITGILYDARGGLHYFRNFYARRILRIFPLYYAVVFFALVILPWFPHQWAANFARVEGDELWYWLYLSNFLIAYHGQFRHAILDISWSLAIEEQFYLVWPLVVACCSRRQLISICGALIGGALTLRVGLVLVETNPITVYALTFCRIDALAVGALIALAIREGALTKLLPYALNALIGSVIVLASVLLVQGGSHWDGAAMQSVGYTALAAVFGSVLILVVSLRRGTLGNRVLSNPLLVTFGKYSYALYLFHLPVRGVIRDLVFGPAQFPTILGSQLPGQLLFYLVSSAATLALAFLSWHLYEKYFLMLKKFFPVAARPNTEVGVTHRQAAYGNDVSNT